MQNTINAVLNEKIIVIVRGVETEKLIPLAEAMYNGGIKLLEITYSMDGSITDEETAHSIKRLSEYFKGKMLIGAGTVLTKKQVKLTKQAGGKFIISPDTNSQIIKYTKRLGLVSMPGALTPSEATLAHRSGADFVKLFPIDSLGSAYLKAIKAPLSKIKLLGVGGINKDNMKEYLNAGCVGFGIGTNIVNKEMIKNNDFDGITELAKAYVNEIK